MTRWMLLATLVATTTSASALPVIGVSDAGSEVHVIANGMVAADGHLEVIDDRIEVRLKERPVGTAKVIVEDRVVKRIEVSESDPPRLSIQTRWGPRTTAKIAKVAVLETLSDGIRIRLPHDVDRPVVAPSAQANPATTAPSPSASPAAAPAKTEASSPAIAPAKDVPISGEPKLTDLKATEPQKSKEPAAEAVAFGKERSGKALTNLGTTEDSGSTLAWGLVAILALGGLSAAAWLKQRRLGLPDAGEISIVSQANVGPKTRVVLLGVQGRQLLLSVSERGAELLTEITEERRELSGGRGELRQDQAAEARVQKSAAITGLLEMKKRVDAPADNGGQSSIWAQRLMKELRKEGLR